MLINVANKTGIDRFYNCGLTTWTGEKRGNRKEALEGIEGVIHTGCTYYSHETNYQDIRFFVNGKNEIDPYKNIRALTLIRNPLDHAFSALGHFAR